MIIKRLGRQPYRPVLEAMQAFTAARDRHTDDELWLLEHEPVFTLGQAGRPEHLLRPLAGTGIELVNIDRGGQITYHAPGQLVAYLLWDIARAGLKVRELVHALEQALIDVLADHHINARRRTGAPGVYVGDAKIAALGLRVRHGCCYHGLALNIDCALEPFGWMNPCGYEGLATTRMVDCGVADATVETVAERLLPYLARIVGQ